MAPILQYCLPAMGFCCNFSHAIIFCPAKYMGVNILHLYTLQEILHIKDIIYHTTYNTGTGSFYRISLEMLLLELGIDSDLSLISYNRFSALATPSLVKSTSQFLDENNFRLQHDNSLPVPRLHNRLLMIAILKCNPSLSQLLAVNKCCIYLRAYFISDIMDGNGSHLSDDAWMGRIPTNSRSCTWPTHGPPTRGDWETWRLCIKKSILARGMRLLQPLGPWTYIEEGWEWYFSPDTNQLLRKDGESWFYRHHQPRRNGRLTFMHIETTCSPPTTLYKASIHGKGNLLVCNGSSPIRPLYLPLDHPSKNFSTPLQTHRHIGASNTCTSLQMTVDPLPSRFAMVLGPSLYLMAHTEIPMVLLLGSLLPL
jgi:hypothetical protein